MNYFLPIFADASIYFVLSLSLWITLRICRFPDLALEQWFVIGGAAYVFSINLSAQYSFFILAAITICLALVGGGVCSFLRNSKAKVHPIIISLCVSLLLYTASLYMMGKKPNYFIPNQSVPSYEDTAIIAVIVFFILVFLISLVSKKKLGLKVIAAGCNWKLAERHHLKPTRYQALGLSVGFLLSMTSGILYSWRSTNADLSYGQGLLISTIFIVVLTYRLSPRIDIPKNAMTLAGVTIFYTAILSSLQAFGFPPQANRAFISISLILLVIVVKHNAFSELSFS